MIETADVYVVQKKTTLERCTSASATDIAFLNRLRKEDQNEKAVFAAHEEHCKTRELLKKSLKRLGFSYVLLTIDDLLKGSLGFYDEQNEHTSGFQPRKQLVISLGGDGTLLHASHYVGGKTKLLGINSCPGFSVGHLCSAKPEEIDAALESSFAEKDKIANIHRIKICFQNEDEKEIRPRSQRLPLALNDVLCCHKHPASTSRYQLSIRSLENEKSFIQSEKQLSSGVWISTSLGRTAAVTTYQFPDIPLDSPTMLVATREACLLHHAKTQVLNKMVLNGKKNFLSFSSLMRQGIICIDGSDFCFPIGFSETVNMSVPPSCTIRFVCGF